MNPHCIHRHFETRIVRTLLLFLCMGVLTIVNTQAQVLPKPDGSSETQQQSGKVEQNENTDQSKKRFIDEDGDGLHDQGTRKRGPRSKAVDERKLRKRRRDHFIDLDGDGINDNRCNGVGIMRGQRRGKAQVK